MKKIVVFGGTGGLGKKIIPFLKDKYEVISVSSKEIDITSLDQTKKFFDINDICLNFTDWSNIYMCMIYIYIYNKLK
jgi:dTDP-4-dehydrorhamnose reductase